MIIHLTKEAQEMLPKGRKTFILTTNDGSNIFSSSEGCCMIGDRFLLVATNDIPSTYTEKFTHGNLTIYSSPYDLNFLSGNLKIVKNHSTGFLNLQNESGRLDDNLEIKIIEN